jgi:Trk K+ transport system NAD-binding subunit/Kef-type K+ transport system membrane component KefB
MTLTFTLSIFGVLALASKQIGAFFRRINLPLISGYLIGGILVGPFVLNLISEEAVSSLLWLDEVSLAFIAFAAGSEINTREMVDRLKSIGWATAGLVVSTYLIVTTVVFLIAPAIPFLANTSDVTKIAAGLLIGSIMVARSPSSAIAIIQELRAKGRFTQTIMGVTVVSDVVVIAVFAFSASMAGTLLEGASLNFLFFVILAGELALSVFAGWLINLLLQLVMAINMHKWLKSAAVLAIGFSIYQFSFSFRHWTHELGQEILLEPLMVGMVASFIVSNFSKHRNEFLSLLHDVGPTIYIVFFTLTGASLALDVLAQTWQIALILFFVRLLTIILGAFVGGTIAGDPGQFNRLSWMAYITQAGVGLGLAKEAAVEFSQLGNEFPTLIIAVIVINQLVGPPLFKNFIRRVGEAHEKSNEPQQFDGIRDAIIFGLENQAVALGKQLTAYDWQVVVVDVCNPEKPEASINGGIQLTNLPEISLEALKKLDLDRADGIAILLTDEENLKLVNLLYENYNCNNIVVRLNDHENAAQFEGLQAQIVHPSTAMVGLMEHTLRTPAMYSLFFEPDGGMLQDVMEVIVTNPSVHNKALRDIQLPLETLVLQISREDRMIVSQGYTRLMLGDRVTVMGEPSCLDEVQLKLES